MPICQRDTKELSSSKFQTIYQASEKEHSTTLFIFNILTRFVPSLIYLMTKFLPWTNISSLHHRLHFSRVLNDNLRRVWSTFDQSFRNGNGNDPTVSVYLQCACRWSVSTGRLRGSSRVVPRPRVVDTWTSRTAGTPLLITTTARRPV